MAQGYGGLVHVEVKWCNEMLTYGDLVHFKNPLVNWVTDLNPNFVIGIVLHIFCSNTMWMYYLECHFGFLECGPLFAKLQTWEFHDISRVLQESIGFFVIVEDKYVLFKVSKVHLLISVHHSFSELKRTFMLMIKIAKGVELGKSIIYYISSK